MYYRLKWSEMGHVPGHSGSSCLAQNGSSVMVGGIYIWVSGSGSRNVS